MNTIALSKGTAAMVALSLVVALSSAAVAQESSPEPTAPAADSEAPDAAVEEPAASAVGSGGEAKGKDDVQRHALIGDGSRGQSMMVRS